MKQAREAGLIVVLTAGLLFGCAHAASYDPDEMYALAARLSKLSRAVDGVVAIRGAPENASEDELLTLATADDPSLRTAFRGYKLHVLRQARNSAVLVCTPDDRSALLEDAGCTGRFERHWWKDDPEKPCAFTLDVAAICGTR